MAKESLENRLKLAFFHADPHHRLARTLHPAHTVGVDVTDLVLREATRVNAHAHDLAPGNARLEAVAADTVM